MVKKKEEKKDEWNPANLLTEDKINTTIENLAHFTFKISNSNAVSGGLIAEKVKLDGYVTMSNIMSGNEYDLMNNPSGQAKIFKRINAVIERNEKNIFNNVNENEVLYIKEALENINGNQSLNLGIQNKRLKQIIVQDKNINGDIENKELIMLRSSGFAKILTKYLQKEREEQELNDKIFYRRKVAKLSFGGANPINIGVNGYLMSNVLYFATPTDKPDQEDLNIAYKIHHTGFKLYDLISVGFLKDYLSYQKEIKDKNRINSYYANKEKELIEDLFSSIKSAVTKKYKILNNFKEIFPNKELFSDNILKAGNEDKLVALTVIGKGLNKESDEKFINCLIAVLQSKTFEVDNQSVNLLLSNDNVFNIKKVLRELLWQNI